MTIEQLIDTVADELGHDAAEITADTRFAEDLGCDSLDMWDLIIRIETDQVDHGLPELDIPEEDFAKATTVGKLLALINGESEDDDLDEPLGERTTSCDGDVCESCQ
jgi:acyl carrier protein